MNDLENFKTTIDMIIIFINFGSLIFCENDKAILNINQKAKANLIRMKQKRDEMRKKDAPLKRLIDNGHSTFMDVEWTFDHH